MSTYLISDHVPPRLPETLLSIVQEVLLWRELGKGWVSAHVPLLLTTHNERMFSRLSNNVMFT